MWLLRQRLVAPLAGARIEIGGHQNRHHRVKVAPIAGARIEITTALAGLKKALVAPIAGARIEITMMETGGTSDTSRSHRGSAD